MAWAFDSRLGSQRSGGFGHYRKSLVKMEVLGLESLLASGSSHACHWVPFFSSLGIAPGDVVFVLEGGSVALRNFCQMTPHYSFQPGLASGKLSLRIRCFCVCVPRRLECGVWSVGGRCRIVCWDLNRYGLSGM